MNNQIDHNHPICVAEILKERYGDDIIFELSQYIYLNQSVKDIRDSFTLRANMMNRAAIQKIISNLPTGKELALHSKIIIREKDIFHIPMIDFVGKLDSSSLALMKEILPEKVFKNIMFFKSGISYHAYSIELISTDEWVRFMGKLLLLNLPNKKPNVDIRWIGHRLIGGYSSLRWSCNTTKYKITPSLINLNTL